MNEHLATDVEVLGKTKGGKEIGIRIKDGEGHWTVAFKTGGEVPKSLTGSYSNKRFAVQAVLKHLVVADEAPAKEVKVVKKEVKKAK